MTARTLKYALTRFFTWSLVGGGAFLMWHGWLILGGIVAGLGALNGLRLARKPGLDAELALVEQARAHGVRRNLTYRERRTLEQVNAYARTLEEHALEPGLGKELLAEAWRVVRECRGVDATEELEGFLESMPALEGAVAPPGDPLAPVKGLSARIRDDLERRRKIDQELDQLS